MCRTIAFGSLMAQYSIPMFIGSQYAYCCFSGVILVQALGGLSLFSLEKVRQELGAAATPLFLKQFFVTQLP